MGAKTQRIAELEEQVALLTYERDGFEASMEVCGHVHEKTTPREITRHQLREKQVVSFHHTEMHKIFGGRVKHLEHGDNGEPTILVFENSRRAFLLRDWNWETTRITVHQDPARPAFVADLKAAPVRSELRRPNGWEYATKAMKRAERRSRRRQVRRDPDA